MNPSVIDPRAAVLKRLADEGRDPETIIRLARREGRDERLSADLVADVAVPEGPLHEDHPDYMTDRDPWSVAWDVADDLLHPVDLRTVQEEACRQRRK